ncbi:hypothetical protein BBO99_00004904 [Phytophthora kernoviae]|uniref:Uncharacterized protein n=1 Tax=Phytophthora kernoviae TaxID=325452 RepID=A0A3R7KU98_9STRA|nr:hypothetical protein JM16_004993 [Phytophthora kernoviae]KAG2526109.1 hypothetical protein JM18_004232 [Phytophthora kernoviae]RLN02802.1 hypothetical protein BBI17_005006 [Phytophthora kernoviae]RLN79921.1 hypothetical protein BBO99_00004904 [Phytophthora kernoviae]
MAPNVRDGDVFGVEALLKNRRLFAVYFKGIQVDLDRLEIVADNSLIATTTTTIKISEKTLQRVFPHLNSDGNGGAQGGNLKDVSKVFEGALVTPDGRLR